MLWNHTSVCLPPPPHPSASITDFWASSKVFSIAVIWLSLSLYISSSVNCCFTETPILGRKKKAFRGHWIYLNAPPSLPTHHNLLNLRLLIGNAITIELSGDVLCLPHPWHHLCMLLGSGAGESGTSGPHYVPPIRASPESPLSTPSPLGAGRGLNLLFQKLLISWI